MCTQSWSLNGLVSENKQSLESSDFHKAVLQEGINSLLSECKPDDKTPWKKQTVFMAEEEDEYWLDYKLKEKLTTHLLYQLGDDDNEFLQKEVFSSSKEKKPSLSKPEVDKDIPREVKDPPKEIKDPPPAPPVKEKLFRIPKVRSCPEGMSAIGVL